MSPEPNVIVKQNVSITQFTKTNSKIVHEFSYGEQLNSCLLSRLGSYQSQNSIPFIQHLVKLNLDLHRFRAGQLSHYATLASNASGLMPPRYEWRRRVL